MKKLLGIVVFSLLWCSPVLANIFCLIGKSALEKGKLDEGDIPRFAGKVIKFQINMDEKIISDVSESSQLSVLTGINESFIPFTKLGNGIKYSNQQEVKGNGGKILKYNYNNTLLLEANNTKGKLNLRISQSGISLKKFNFSFFCRSYDYTIEEKEAAKLVGVFPFGSSVTKKKKENKKKIFDDKYKETVAKENLIVDLENYTSTDLDALLYLYKVKFFENKITNFVFLKNRKYLNFDKGQMITFENILDLNEREFFNLPMHNSDDKNRLKSLKKSYLKDKKLLKKQS